MNAEIYQKYLSLATPELIVDEFHRTIIDTNRGHNFFVDWDKIKSHVQRYKVEFNILNSLIGSRKFDADLRALLVKYPEIIPILPILIAVRGAQLKVIEDFSIPNSDIVEYDFKKRDRSKEDVEILVGFCQKTGLKYFFETLSAKCIQDYVTGVEVGMDTHARKNRSGDAMELALKPIFEEIEKNGNGKYEVLFQKKFGYLKDKFGLKVSTAIENRKADFIVLKNNQKTIVNIEVNFYSGTGSKPQEIVDAYINRQSELKQHGFKFIWITDGHGWKGQKNQIQKGFEEIGYLLNMHFVRKGLLKKILEVI